MSLNWIRKCKLTIGTGSGDLDVSGMRIRFIIFRKIIQTPNSGWFRIYNLSKDTASKIASPNTIGKTVKLEAGYNDNIGPIFQGQIVYAVTGRESPTDTYVDVYCADGGKGINEATAQKTFDPGSKQEDHVNYLLQQFGDVDDIQKGVIRGLSDMKYPKAVTLYGRASDMMRNIAKSNEATWWVDMGKLYHVPLKNDQQTNKPFGTITLNANTGLIGMPQETTEGIIVTALINPSYELDVELVIDEKSINRGPWDLSLAGQVQSAFAYSNLGTADGQYVIDAIEYRGDTRGQEWYAIMTCHGNKHSGIPNDFVPRQTKN